VPIEPSAADFCLLTKRVRDQLVAMPERHRMLRGMLAWVGFRRTFLDFDAPPRVAGATKYRWRRRLALAIDGVLGFSTAPIRLTIWVGLVVAALGALYLGYVLGTALWTGDLVAGWPSLISVVLILGGLQIVFIGVLGAYLGRVFEQSKGRPLYVLRREVEPGPRR
jgi:dolichol-phosphate mannosyltransferase